MKRIYLLIILIFVLVAGCREKNDGNNTVPNPPSTKTPIQGIIYWDEYTLELPIYGYKVTCTGTKDFFVLTTELSVNIASEFIQDGEWLCYVQAYQGDRFTAPSETINIVKENNILYKK